MGSTELHGKITWYEQIAINIARSAPIPKHVAFIMDGNRRFAEKMKINKETGIEFGYNRFVQLITWSLLLGIKVITVYALSIENLKRPKCEVDFIFSLFQDKLNLFLTNLDYYLRNGVRFNFIGNIDLLSKNLQVFVSKIALATKQCTVIQVNIAIMYTSREDICNAIKLVVHGVKNNEIEVDDIDESFFTRCLYTRECPEVDLMVRTSGENRLSDFLLWQSASSSLVFMQTLWPEIKLWEIIFQIVRYQRSVIHSRKTKKFNEISSNAKVVKNYDQFLRIQLFLDNLNMETEQKLEHLQKITFEGIE